MKPCLKLRQKMLERDYSNTELARKIHRSTAQVSAILCAKKVADASDIYAIGTVLNIPQEEWGSVFFPPEVVRLITKKLEERS